MTARLEVALISPIPPPAGGMGTWTLRMAEYSSQRSEVRIHHVELPFERAILESGLISRVDSGLRQLAKVKTGLESTLRATKIDVIHLTTSGSLGTARDLVLLRWARRRGIPVVYHLHFGRLPEVLSSGGWEARLLRSAIRRASHTIVLDQTSRTAIRSHLPECACTVVPNPIDLDALEEIVAAARATPIPGLAPGCFALFAGHVRPAKGVSELIRAWAFKPIPGWKLVIAGAIKGEYPQHIVDELNVAESVIVTGELDQEVLLRLTASCGIFALPSHTEGFPNSLLEAMALSRPVVATPVGAIPEMLPDGIGLLVPVGDPQALASALQTLAQAPHLRDAMGSAALDRVRSTYTVHTVFDQYLSVWQRVAGH